MATFLSRTRTVGSVALLGCVALWPAAVASQEVPEATVKAGFLYNFAKFTEWPATRLPAGAPVVFCVSDPPVAEDLHALVSGLSISNHRLRVKQVRPDDLLADCAVLYITDIDARRARPLLASLTRDNVLSVSDIAGFTDVGGVIRIYPERGRLRFEINVTAAARANLRLGSQLLGLAPLVKDRIDDLP